jgi:glycosyltransferase involved in cell wall biosynthesis
MKIILSATTSWNLYNSRMGLAKALKKDGHEVVLLSPKDEFSQLLLDEGFRWVHLPLRPRGKNIFQELRAIAFTVSFYRREKPDLVNHFTPKGVIYGSIAAKLSDIPVILNTITGLGHVFSGKTNKFLRIVVLTLYRIALKNTKILFQNPDDQHLFITKRIVDPQKSYFVPGSGIDMERFKVTPEAKGVPIVILSSRFVEEKGIRYFVEASRILKSRQAEVKFVLVGRPEGDQPTSIHHIEITHWVNEGLIEWWGWHNTMEQIYPLAHIVCLPTYYMEGIPKSLIEAAACGRPLIATDVPGCREIVRHGENGLLIQTQNSEALADAILKIVNDRNLRKKMGLKSREIAVTDFAMEKIIAEYFKIYGLSQ